MFWLVLLFAGVGVLTVALAIPMILGKVPPNNLYGFRTTKTLSDPEIWYPANAYAGKWLLVWGVIMVVAAFLPLWLLPDLTEDGYAIFFMVVSLGGLLLVILMSWRYLKNWG